MAGQDTSHGSTTPGFSLIRVLARVPDCWGSSGCCWGMPSSFRACYTPSLASVGSLSVPTGKGSAPITREQPGITPSEAHSHTCSSSQPDRRGACARPLP